jgi:hypothetical protein
MADEQLVVEDAGRLLRLSGVEARLGAGEVGAVGEDGSRDNDVFAVGRDAEGADIEG